jgi:hypothetical protein
MPDADVCTECGTPVMKSLHAPDMTKAGYLNLQALLLKAGLCLPCFREWLQKPYVREQLRFFIEKKPN